MLEKNENLVKLDNSRQPLDHKNWDISVTIYLINTFNILIESPYRSLSAHVNHVFILATCEFQNLFFHFYSLNMHGYLA